MWKKNTKFAGHIATYCRSICNQKRCGSESHQIEKDEILGSITLKILTVEFRGQFLEKPYAVASLKFTLYEKISLCPLDAYKKMGSSEVDNSKILLIHFFDLYLVIMLDRNIFFSDVQNKNLKMKK